MLSCATYGFILLTTVNRASFAAPQVKYWKGLTVEKHVPEDVLPADHPVVLVAEFDYRVIGPQLVPLTAEVRQHVSECLVEAHNMFGAPPTHFQARLKETVPAPQHTNGISLLDKGGSAFLRQSGSKIDGFVAQEFASIDIQVRVGVTRDSQVPDLGGNMRVFTRMLYASLRAKGYEVKWVVMDFNTLKSGAFVFRFLPITPLYSEETVVQMEGHGLLPFTLEKENAFLTALDNLDTFTVGVGYAKVTNVTVVQSKSGNKLLVAVRTMKQAPPDTQYATILQSKMQTFHDEMESRGLKVAATIHSSKYLWGDAVADKLLAHLRDIGLPTSPFPFDTREPAPIIQRLEQKKAQPLKMGVAVATLCCLAVSLMIHGWQRSKARSQHLPSEGQNSTSGSSFKAWLASAGINADSESFWGDSASEHLPQEWLDCEEREILLQRGAQRAAALGSWRIAPEDLQILRMPDGRPWLLGQGAFGSVYKGVRKGVSEVAIKTFDCGNHKIHLEHFRMEISILKSLSYDGNICQFQGVCVMHDVVMLVMELMEGGDLRAALSSERGQEVRWLGNGAFLALDVTRALVFLHSNKVVHGDIKSRNVLLTKSFELAKVADVGMSRIMEGSVLDPIGVARGTFNYAAPELLLGGRCTEKVDIYSLGVLLWEICTGEVPVRGQLRCLQPGIDCPAAIVMLIDSCIEKPGDQRPSAKQVFDVIKASMAADDCR